MHRLFYILFWLIIFILPIILIAALPWERKYKFYQRFYRLICRIFNIEIVVKGEISTQRPLVFVGNHTSYLDIIILGAALPASFVSKAEVANWPLVGSIGKLTGTLFIKRERRLVDSHVEQMQAALQHGENLIFFPEGTTGDGMRPLPFKTSLFKLAERHKVFIQPFTVRFSHINGLPIYRNEKSLMAWIGDMSLMPHLKAFLRLGRVRVEVVMHAAIPPAENLETVDRKILAKRCEEIVGAAF